jgi:RsiW-degrading membrane proteinase PrsW (M82 family)
MYIFILVLVFIVIGVGFTFFLLKSDKGQKEPVGALWTAFLFGIVAAIIAGIIENLLVPLKDTKPGVSLVTMLISFIVVGIIEESLKFWPLAGFIYRKKYFNEHTDGIIYFALVGLGFGIPENILYTVQFGSKVGIARIVLTPLFHSALTAMIGYFLIKAKLNKRSFLTVIIAFLSAVLLHGIYDFGLSSGNTLLMLLSFAITLALTINLFNLFYKARARDESIGLSAVGHTNYCRHCGYINKNHSIYCISCGQRA